MMKLPPSELEVSPLSREISAIEALSNTKTSLPDSVEVKVELVVPGITVIMVTQLPLEPTSSYSDAGIAMEPVKEEQRFQKMLTPFLGFSIKLLPISENKRIRSDRDKGDLAI